MNFRKTNNLAGWITGIIAFIVYLKTMEPTCSFWDCGEFISCAYKLEGGHAPGFPTLMMLQRLFALFAGAPAFTGQPSISTLGQVGAATCINALTAVMSALTILFLFWTISYFAKKLIVRDTVEPDKNQTILILGAALVGALAYTFSDTFWFSAVEAIPFGTSPFFTAFTFWSILKWERVADNKYADRWLLLISLVIGLAVGVHLLILLVIPPISMIYYFRRYPQATWLGGIIAFAISVAVLAFIMFGIIRYIPMLASYFDILFTNSYGAPFDTGAITFLLLLAAGLVALLVVAKKKNNYVLHISTLCTMFIIMGYSTYFSAIIRARAGVPINMTNPSYPNSFLDYVDREQFGQQPIFFGPYYNSRYEDIAETGKLYAPVKENGKDHYEIAGKKQEPVYASDQTHFFPRIYDNEPGHANFYKSFLGLGDNDEPTGIDNLKYFFGYQMNWMWFRFFMWNYAGRQNDIEGQLDPQGGNWISGITFIDKMRGLGDTDKMGSGYSENGHNKLYCLPLILGIIGLIYQFNRNKKEGTVILTLFFFTGIAIGIFLNMPPVQPRERDYAFAGCGYTFAIWIGLGVLMIAEWLRKVSSNPVVAYGGAIGLCLLAVPALMAKEEWKDHDRSKKTLARAVAYNTLSCCAPNAILFSYGDNQTYPLWYIQEVEGFRKDVRIINTSLLGIGWYIDELNYRINDADAVPMTWTSEDYVGDRHNYVFYKKNPQIPDDKYFNLTDICKFMNSNDPANMAQTQRNNEQINYMPSKNFFASSLSKEELVKKGLVDEADTSRINTEMKFTFPKSAAYKSDLAVLNIISAVANDGWKRPIYFDAGLRQGDYAGTGDYMHMEGLVYRLMPYKYNDVNKVNTQVLGSINTTKGYNLFMNTFIWGGSERNDVYFDEPNRHELITYRIDGAFLANQLIAENKKDKAIQVVDKVVNNITEHSYPYSYDYSGYLLAAAYYRAGAIAKANDLTKKIVRDAEDYVTWASTLSDNSKADIAGEVKMQFQIMQSLSGTAYQVGDSATAKQIYLKMNALGPKVKELLNTREAPGGGGDEE